MFSARHPFCDDWLLVRRYADAMDCGSGMVSRRIVMGPFSAVYNGASWRVPAKAGRAYTVRSAGFTVNDAQQMKKTFGGFNNRYLL